ncbi:MAG: YifB family Mg chelatase-like AAA ATPase [Actinomycetota bacterium]
MFATIPSAVILGAEGHRVSVEVHVGDGLPGFHLVGLPDASVREARDRVRAAIMSTGRSFPSGKITVNLAPSQTKKTGSGLDLAIAVGILVADRHVQPDAVSGLGFVGELGLDGSVRGVAGCAPMVGALRSVDPVVAVASRREAVVATDRHVRAVATLTELVDTLACEAPWPDHDDPDPPESVDVVPDLREVRGQEVARLALELSAIGGHHLLLVGPPGAGKTMLAERLPGLLPDLEPNAALETSMVHSAAGLELPTAGLVTRPPFRSPHHTASQVAIVGGGSHALRPGEISIATNGVLFLDELPEFPVHVLETLRQPLESGRMSINRAALSTVLPADFLLVAAMNPCPCGGGRGDPSDCTCGHDRVRRYRSRLSGPVLDRFDLRIRVTPPDTDQLMSSRPGESSAEVAPRVAAARARALERQGVLNGRLAPAHLDSVAPLTESARAAVRHELERGRLSGRGYHRIRRLSRSIADRRSAESVDLCDVDLALQLRSALSPASTGRAA